MWARAQRKVKSSVIAGNRARARGNQRVQVEVVDFAKEPSSSRVYKKREINRQQNFARRARERPLSIYFDLALAAKRSNGRTMPATTISPPPPVACSSSKKPWQNPAFPFLPSFPPSRRELYHRAICPRLIAKTKCFSPKFVRVSKIPFPLSSLSFLRFQVRIKPATARQGRSGPTSARTPLSRSICVRPSVPPSLHTSARS